MAHLLAQLLPLSSFAPSLAAWLAKFKYAEDAKGLHSVIEDLRDCGRNRREDGMRNEGACLPDMQSPQCGMDKLGGCGEMGNIDPSDSQPCTQPPGWEVWM